MLKAYEAMAEAYEYLMRDVDYKSWTQYVCSAIERYKSGNRGVDLACGSGIFTSALKRCGNEMTGVDNSEAILVEAQKKNCGAQFILQNITSLKLPFKADFITCINDGYNYVPGEKLHNAFNSAYKNLKRDGLFLFDISTEYKLKEIIGNNTFWLDDEKVSYIWTNELKEDRVAMELTFFYKREDGLYERREECHTQYIHRDEIVQNLLKSSGFELIKREGHLGAKADEKSERLNYIAIKR